MASDDAVTADHISRQIDEFIQQVTQWASAQSDVQAVALVGSYARNAATEASDIDLILITRNPDRYLENTEWVERFGSVVKQQREDYGKVISLRVWYANGYEVEYGITTPEWAQPPLDEGTRKVITDGMKILFERDALLSSHVGD
jgi:predicted nucleotidyltransferase